MMMSSRSIHGWDCTLSDINRDPISDDFSLQNPLVKVQRSGHGYKSARNGEEHSGLHRVRIERTDESYCLPSSSRLQGSIVLEEGDPLRGS